MERGLKRPAADEKETEEDIAGSKPRKLAAISLREIKELGPIYVGEARYYGRLVQVAGRVVGLRQEGEESFLDLYATGVKDDGLLQILTGKREPVVAIHLCDPSCSGLLTDECLLHAQEYEPVDLRRLPWLTNLKAVRAASEDEDEWACLREEKRRRREEVGAEALPDKKKKKKKRKSEEKIKEGRVDQPPKEDEGDVEIGQMPLGQVFKGTGLDPDAKKRGRVIKRARKIGKGKRRKKKKESSSTDDGDSSSTSTEETDDVAGTLGLFEAEQKLKSMWRKCPGALTHGALSEARERLMSSSGALWNISKGELPPLFLQYGRQQLIGTMSISPALQQEIATVCYTLDHLLLGRVAKAADLLSQRLKSLESLVRGCHWSVGRQLELIRTDLGGIAEESETLSAARRAREEEKLRTLVSRPAAGKGNEYGQGGKTRKGKATGKGRSDESGKGKVSEGKKEDQKGGWQKK